MNCSCLGGGILTGERRLPEEEGDVSRLLKMVDTR